MLSPLKREIEAQSPVNEDECLHTSHRNAVWNNSGLRFYFPEKEELSKLKSPMKKLPKLLSIIYTASWAEISEDVLGKKKKYSLPFRILLCQFPNWFRGQ